MGGGAEQERSRGSEKWEAPSGAESEPNEQQDLQQHERTSALRAPAEWLATPLRQTDKALQQRIYEYNAAHITDNR